MAIFFVDKYINKNRYSQDMYLVSIINNLFNIYLLKMSFLELFIFHFPLIIINKHINRWR